VHDFVNHQVGLLGRCARRQAESSRVLERALQRHFVMDDVILRHVADARAGHGTGTDLSAVVHDLASRGCTQPSENPE
jgi:hypothetical protein